MRGFLLLFTAACLLFSTSCGTSVGFSDNYRAIEELLLVHTIGFDSHPEGLECSVVGGEHENQGILRLSAPGKTISDAYRLLQNFSGKEELYYAHTRYVLVGEEYAQEGVESVMNYLESSAQLRSDLPMFVVKDGTAKKLLMQAGGKERSIYEVMEAVVRECTVSGNGYPFTCGDIAVYSAEYGSALICALSADSTMEINPSAEKDELTPVLSGYGVLKEGKLVGYLSTDAAKGVSLLMDELGTGDITILSDGRPISLRLTDVHTTLVPAFGPAGTVTGLTVELEVAAALEEAEQKHKLDLQQVSQQLETDLQQWVNHVLMTMSNTGTDFLGFGRQIAIRYPDRWAQNQNDWLTRIKTLPMQAEVQCSVSMGENEQRRISS